MLDIMSEHVCGAAIRRYASFKLVIAAQVVSCCKASAETVPIWNLYGFKIKIKFL